MNLKHYHPLIADFNGDGYPCPVIQAKKEIIQLSLSLSRIWETHPHLIARSSSIFGACTHSPPGQLSMLAESPPVLGS
tara:strand:+ start:166 stop:399 length:234 start_codon:yes stop_codon:yes gene_type:complete